MLRLLLGQVVRLINTALWGGILPIWDFTGRALQAHPLAGALLGCSFNTLSYVGILYLWTDLPRNHPNAIRIRMVSTLVACSLAWLPVYLSLPTLGPAHPLFLELQNQGMLLRLTRALGLRGGPLLTSVGWPLVHSGLLFACPLGHKLATEGWPLLQDCFWWLKELALGVGHADIGRVINAVIAPYEDEQLWKWRDLVVGPLTEEWAFRACMAPLLLLAGCSTAFTVTVIPFFFGAAHLHHLYDLTAKQGMPLSRALFVVAVQLTYTTLFGWYATWLFLRSASLWTPVVVHSACNWLGLPDFKAMNRLYGHRFTLIGTAGGIAAFIWFMPALTSPSLLGSGPLQVF